MKKINDLKEKMKMVNKKVKCYVTEHKKRISIIAAFSILLIGSAGTFILYNTSTDKSVITDISKKKESNDTTKTNTKEGNTSKEKESTGTDTTKISEDKKKETSKSSDSAAKNITNNSTGNSNSSGTSEKKADSGNTTSSGATNNSVSTTNNGSTESSKTWHEPVYKTVHHDAEYQSVYVKDSDAWTEYVPIYSTIELSICNVCGADITGNTTAHTKAHALAGEGGGTHSEWKEVQTGTQEIQHAESGHYENQLVREAWTEQVLVREGGYY